MAPVDHFRIVRPAMPGVSDLIPQLIQCLHDDAEGASLIVTFEIFNILQHKDRRLTGGDNSHHIKKQRPLGFAGKAVGATHGIFFRYAGE